MASQQRLEVIQFIQTQLDAGHSNQDIVDALRLNHDTDISTRTLQRWIEKHGLQRASFSSAFERSSQWIGDVKNLIKRNIPLNNIVYHLQKTYAGSISLITLRRVLKEHDISIRQQIPPVLVEAMVAVQSQTDGKSLGCRAMTMRLRNVYDVNVAQDAVSAAQRKLDPSGVAGRRKRRLARREYFVDGPNALWHFDQNDKLRQFGFELHACIDGWSRKLIWLHVGASNRIPEWIAAYWVEAVSTLKLLPARQRSDRGAENSLAAAIQQHYNDEASHTFGRSVANQRIESWWNQMYAGGVHFGSNSSKI